MEQVLEHKTVYNESLGDCTTVFENTKRLIHYLIQKYFRNSTVEYDDLFQIGCIGFLKAYKNYDPNKLDSNGKPYRFSSYLSATIIGEIRRNLRDIYLGDGLKIPRRVSENYAKIVKADTDFSDPIEKLSEQTGIEPEEVEEVLAFLRMRNYQSLDKVVIENDGADENITLEEQLGEEQDLSVVEVNDFISHFNEREQQIIRLRMKGMSQQDIAKEIGLSQAQVSRLLEGKIKRALMDYLNGEKPRVKGKNIPSERILKEAEKYLQQGYSVYKAAKLAGIASGTLSGYIKRGIVKKS